MKLVDRVFDQLQERIRSGNYPPDSRLPGEHELASLLGVSRPIVRDALARLRDQGIVYARQGAGTFVSAHGSPTTQLSYSPVKTIADIQRCYEFRLTIEPAAAYFAAKRRDEAAIQKIAAALADLREATSHQLHRTDADFMFHRCGHGSRQQPLLHGLDRCPESAYRGRHASARPVAARPAPGS